MDRIRNRVVAPPWFAFAESGLLPLHSICFLLGMQMCSDSQIQYEWRGNNGFAHPPTTVTVSFFSFVGLGARREWNIALSNFK